MGFKEEFNALKVRIENNKALDDFCRSNFGKPISVYKIFRNRTEISTSEMPIVLLTRPGVNREFAGNIPKKLHSVYIYGGFLCEDRLKAVDLSIEFEELIEAAVMTRTSHQDDRPVAVMPADSQNDEGMYHPVYFFVMHLQVKER